MQKAARKEETFWRSGTETGDEQVGRLSYTGKDWAVRYGVRVMAGVRCLLGWTS